MKTAYLGLGSNVGRRKQNINKALSLLEDNDCIDVLRVSTLIKTSAVSKLPQPYFINGAMEIKTILTPLELLSITQNIECQLGRTAKGTDDPRTIDLDILFFDDQILCEDDLIIPHPLLHDREFVLIPMKEIAPDLIHPVLNETIDSLYNKVIGY
ncbi:MAG: 2-amino-4-hydroxy-6-hydroxymethyldihydropteridine diphosphokinase [bacterium]|nr:2-amino-4-hydroxy-6-hydroxymethyldihydropteridine diphosphokinase [bacterium]